jgi:hypothetical protein
MVAASAMADKKVVAHPSQRVAMQRQSLRQSHDLDLVALAVELCAMTDRGRAIGAVGEGTDAGCAEGLAKSVDVVASFDDQPGAAGMAGRMIAAFL